MGNTAGLEGAAFRTRLRAWVFRTALGEQFVALAIWQRTQVLVDICRGVAIGAGTVVYKVDLC